MPRLRYPLFVALALVVACGGKVLVDEIGNPGAGGSSVGTTGMSGTDVGRSGSIGTAGAYVAGFFDTGGASNIAGSVGLGGAYAAGSGGSFAAGGSQAACGPTFCPPDMQCCNPSCGICVPLGAGCPAIACGGSAGTGFGGSVIIPPGGCGTPARCLSRLPGPLRCASEPSCVCNACMCEADMCESDPGCQQIWGCALKLGCRGKACYAPDACQPVIDSVGLGSNSMNLFLRLDLCESRSGCTATCTGAVDAGACTNPPLPVEGHICNATRPSPDECSWACTDRVKNTFISKCIGSACSCYYNGTSFCNCNQTGPIGGSACGLCCPSMGWAR